MAEPDNLWDVRTDFGLGTHCIASQPTDPARTIAAADAKITGLTPGKSYDVYGVFTPTTMKTGRCARA